MLGHLQDQANRGGRGLLRGLAVLWRLKCVYIVHDVKPSLCVEILGRSRSIAASGPSPRPPVVACVFGRIVGRGRYSTVVTRASTNFVLRRLPQSHTVAVDPDADVSNVATMAFSLPHCLTATDTLLVQARRVQPSREIGDNGGRRQFVVHTIFHLCDVGEDTPRWVELLAGQACGRGCLDDAR